MILLKDEEYDKNWQILLVIIWTFNLDVVVFHALTCLIIQ